MPPFKTYQPKKHEKLTPEVVDEVVRRIEEGLLKLPNSAPRSVRALMDLGAAPNTANHSKHFLGARLQESEGQKKGHQYAAANGQLFADNGQFANPCHTM